MINITIRECKNMRVHAVDLQRHIVYCYPDRLAFDQHWRESAQAGLIECLKFEALQFEAKGFDWLYIGF